VSSIRGGIDPRIPGIQVREIAVDGGHVLLFRLQVMSRAEARGRPLGVAAASLCTTGRS
jgi:hypothetical protein